jgi:quinone-modifying oxidoreductase subunit QmoB
MEKKIAVYLCSGCGIGEAVNIEELSNLVTDDLKAPICRTHANLCSQEGADLIKGDIANEGANTLVIAACSLRVMYDVFNFENCIVDRVNLREQVAWSQKPGEEDTQMLAADYLRMAMAKVGAMELPVPYKPEQEFSRDILVVGGGLAGMTSAIEAAKAGYSVVLVEKEAQLGGFQKKVKNIATSPYKGIQENVVITDLIKAVTSNPKIKVYTSATVDQTVGGPGVFEVSIKQNGSTSQQRIGAIVMAAGWEPYDPTKLDKKLGFGASPDVITNTMFEDRCQQTGITRPSDGKAVTKAAFLQCAGSRDPEHLPYCSTVCCSTSLKQALQIKVQNKDADVFVVYKEMRTPGQAEDLYRKAQEEGVIFIRCQSPEVKANGAGLAVEANDEILGEKVLLDNLDLVVLATGMVPMTAFGPDISKEAKKEEEEKKEEELLVPPDLIRRSNILNLAYRQGPEIPALRHEFPDSHFICFPYETRRTGIYAAGCVHKPMSIASTLEDGAGAVMKAIQCIELTSRGAAVHPRAGDMSFPEFAMQRCTQCKRCTVECPFGAINEDEKANPLPQPTRCRRCGVCMGACPERIISFKNYSVGMIGNMIKAIEVPAEEDEKPRILVLACENDAYPALDMAGLHRMNYNPWMRVIPLRCLGSMNLVWIADALSKGIDGILLLACQHGDDYQCHFIKGSELASIRLSKVSETLNRLALESDRVRFENISIVDYQKLPALLDEFAAKLQEIGPNPFKGW